MTIQEAIKRMAEIRANCEASAREPNAAETKEVEKLFSIVDAIENDEFFRTPQRSRPDDVPCGLPKYGETAHLKASYEIREAGDKKDFVSLYGPGHTEYRWKDKESTFFQALFSERFHPGLTKRALTETVPSDGGFLVPVEYSEQIHNVSLENELVMPMCTVQPMKSNELKLPAMTIGDHSSSLFGGFTASYTAEEGTMTAADPKVREMTLKAKKLTGFIKLSNELVQDIPNGEQQIIDICGKGLGWYRDKAFLKGIVGGPLGILNADCLLVQPKATGQIADSIIYLNLIGMLAKLAPASFKNSVWVFHQSCIPQLLELSIAIGTGGDHIPVMKESDGKFSILTRPCIFTEKTEVLGDQGDALLGDFSQYIVGLRSEMRIDLSQHIYFTTDHLGVRLIERHDGQPLWDEALTLEDGSTEVSPFVTLAERA